MFCLKIDDRNHYLAYKQVGLFEIHLACYYRYEPLGILKVDQRLIQLIIP